MPRFDDPSASILWRVGILSALLWTLPTGASAQTCGQFPDVITAPSRKVGGHACDSDKDGTLKDSSYCYCNDCSIQPERCSGRGDRAFCSCDTSKQFCRPRSCQANGSCPSSDPHSWYWPLDCNDYLGAVFPGACEDCSSGWDENCNGSTTDCGAGGDADGDGYVAPADCNDANPNIHPGAVEIQCNSVDEDCNGSDACGGPVDNDGDGVPIPADCNDADPAVHPGATDRCGDLLDSDCDGLDCLGDVDGDGSLAGADCNDRDASIHPGAFELCGDGVDQDCNGSDRACVQDYDRDGHDAAGVGGDDCDDLDSSVYPGAAEVCDDGKDQNCDGADLDCASFDHDGDGFGSTVFGGPDCDDTRADVHPGAPNLCEGGVDSNCDGQPDPACDQPKDLDGDGFDGRSSGGTDCNDRNSQISPAAPELCGDNIDNDCDGVIDQGCAHFGESGDPNSFVNADAPACGVSAGSAGGGAGLGLLLLGGLLLFVRRRNP